MKVLLITQNDPFYLPYILPKLFQNIQGKHEITHCILLSASPFGKKENILKKIIKTLSIFGFRFFFYYTLKFVYNKIRYYDFLRKFLKNKNVKLIELKESINHETTLAEIKLTKPDILVSILGNEIFKKPLLDIAPCLNLHTAPLPRYRGLMPSFWVLRHGEKQTAVSVFMVDEGIDSGPILVQIPVKIGDKTQSELIKETKILGMEAVAEALDIVASGSMELIENDEAKATYFKFPTRNDVKEFYNKGKKFF